MDINHATIGAELIRQEFERQPPDLQMQTRQRVQRLLVEEAQRNQTTPSVLMRLAHIYGLGRPKEVRVATKRPKHGRHP